MVKTNIAVIGVGGIGFWHLYSLATKCSNMNIEVVDISDQALHRAKEQLHPYKNNIRFFKSIAKLSEIIDVAIIATTAQVRRQVIEELLQQKDVKYLILEKVLFQKIEDYYVVEQLLEKNNVKAWVNCPLRTYPFFQQLRKKLRNSQKMDYFFSSAHLGIACNTIHHIDLLAFLCKQTDFTFDTSHLDKEIISSRRPGFIEFIGTFLGETKEGSLLKVTSYTKDAKRPQTYQINCEDFFCFINVDEQKYFLLERENNWAMQQGAFPKILQSQLTSHIVKEILTKGNSQLTPYNESMKLHLGMIEAFLDFYNRYHDEEGDLCPIT